MAILQEKVGLTNADVRKIKSMRPGRPVDLQISTSGGIKRVRTEFIGMDGKRCLILKFPDETKFGRLKDLIFKDMNMVVRYILEDDTGEIIAFKVKVLLVATIPTDLIFTSFPVAIQRHDLRVEPRSQTSIAVRIEDVAPGEDLCNCVVVDISAHGCRISIDKKVLVNKPELNHTIKMHFLASSSNVNHLVGTIQSTKVDEVSRYYGIKFATSETEVKQLLKEIMVITG